jgi:hypothetical protein
VAAFVAVSMGLALVARRHRMSEWQRWLAILLVGAIGFTFALSYRFLTAALSEEEKWLSTVAFCIGLGWPLWRFMSRAR